jgi:hypothetical protein
MDYLALHVKYRPEIKISSNSVFLKGLKAGKFVNAIFLELQNRKLDFEIFISYSAKCF